MKVLFISAGFLPANSHGGVPFSSFYLASSLKLHGCEVRVITTDRNGSSKLKVPLDCWEIFSGLPVWYSSTLPGPYILSKTIHLAIKQSVKWADIVISSSTLWDYSGFITYFYCKINRTPHVVYPRGLLDEWALQHKWLRKKLFWYIQCRRILKSSSAIVALSEMEKKSIEKLGVKTPIYVIPNGSTEVPNIDKIRVDNLEDNLSCFIKKNSKNYLLFLGRINKKKGLDHTISAMAEAIKQVPTAILVIAGPIEKSYSQELLKLLYQIPKKNFYMTGPVEGYQKELLIRNALGFVLTSYSEGLPIAVLEAMSRHIPVIITKQCNISGVDEYDAGWIVSLGDYSNIAKAICELFQNQTSSLIKGYNAACLVEDKYKWESIAKQTILLFSKLVSTPQKILSQDKLEAFYHDKFVKRQVENFIFLTGSFIKENSDIIVDVGGGVGYFAKAIKDITGIKVCVLDSDNESVNICKKLQIDAIHDDALNPKISGNETIICFNLILHHLVGASEDETRHLQERALSVWHPTTRFIFVDEYIYESYFLKNFSGWLIFKITSSNFLSKIGNFISKFIPTLKANTFGIGVRFRSHKEWHDIFDSLGFDVINTVIGPPEYLNWPRRCLLIKSCRKDSFLLKPKPETLKP